MVTNFFFFEIRTVKIVRKQTYKKSRKRTIYKTLRKIVIYNKLLFNTLIKNKKRNTNQ
jgi:hypothetical protein